MGRWEFGAHTFSLRSVGNEQPLVDEAVWSELVSGSKFPDKQGKYSEFRCFGGSGGVVSA